MSALAERERSAAGLAHRVRAGALRAAGERTLDELVSTAWSALGARAPVACPVCGGHMAAAGERGATGAPPLLGDPHPGGACRDCGAELR
jgi:hypothetical protein